MDEIDPVDALDACRGVVTALEAENARLTAELDRLQSIAPCGHALRYQDDSGQHAECYQCEAERLAGELAEARVRIDALKLSTLDEIRTEREAHARTRAELTTARSKGMADDARLAKRVWDAITALIAELRRLYRDIRVALGGQVTTAATKHNRSKRAWVEAQGGYDAQLKRQGGGCAICGYAPKPGGRKLSVDHNHKTGAGRGLLCMPCNKGLGWFRDNARRLYIANGYVLWGWASACRERDANATENRM